MVLIACIRSLNKGQATRRKIKQQGQDIDAMYEQQDRVYYQLGKSKQKADNLNRGMWFTVCWEPIVNTFKGSVSYNT